MISKKTLSTALNWFEKGENTRSKEQIEDFKQIILQMSNLEALAYGWWIKNEPFTPNTERVEYIKEAAKLAKLNKLDPIKYNSPEDLIYDCKIFPKGKPLNPDDSIHLFDKYQITEDLIVYSVRNDYEGLETVRNFVDSHMGYNANPWCLISRQSEDDDEPKTLDEAFSYWEETYDSINKKIAFYKGKLIAFRASSELAELQWWDRNDSSYPGIPILNTDLTPYGLPNKKGTIVLDEDFGKILHITDIHSGNKRNGIFKKFFNNGNLRYYGQYKNGLKVGEHIHYVNDEEKPTKENYHTKEVYDNKGNFIESFIRNFGQRWSHCSKHFKKYYNGNTLLEEFYYDDNGRYYLYNKYNERGQLLNQEQIKPNGILVNKHYHPENPLILKSIKIKWRDKITDKNKTRLKKYSLSGKLIEDTNILGLSFHGICFEQVDEYKIYKQFRHGNRVGITRIVSETEEIKEYYQNNKIIFRRVFDLKTKKETEYFYYSSALDPVEIEINHESNRDINR